MPFFYIFFWTLCILSVLLILLCFLGNKKAKQICRILVRIFIGICKILDQFFIGTALRKIVENYDKRHGKIKKDMANDATLKVHKELEDSKNENKELQKEIKRLNAALENSKEEYECLSKEMDELKETNEIFSNSIADLRNTIKNLSFEKNKEIVSGIPEKSKEIVESAKSSCLYAEPDATGTILRKISTMEAKYSLFKLELMNEKVCKFYVLNNAATSMYINNRNVSLSACNILEVGINPTRFEMVEAGTAVKNDNNWIVMEPAKIKIL